MFRIDFNKLRFLVCDDNPHMRRILRTLLHSFGAREVYEVRGRRHRARNVHPLRARHRHHRLGDADLRRPRTGADDPAAGIQGQPLRADHHADRPFRKAPRHRGARRRRHRISRQADLGQGPLSAHPQRRRQSAPVHQDQDLFRSGPPPQHHQRLYRPRAPRRRRDGSDAAAVAARQGPTPPL